MSHSTRRFISVAALCLATLLGGCVIVPEHGYRHGYYGPGPWFHDGWHR